MEPSSLHTLLFSSVTILIICHTCVLCWDSSYEKCQNSNRVCGNACYGFPIGVGDQGCGDSRLQINCTPSHVPLLKIASVEFSVVNFSEVYDNRHGLGYGLFLLELQRFNCNNNPTNSNSSNINVSNPTVLAAMECLQHISYDYDMDITIRLCDKENLTAEGSSPCHPKERTTDIWQCLPSANKTSVALQTCRACERSAGICGYTDQTYFICYCKDGSHDSQCPPGVHSWKRKFYAAVICGCVGLVAAVTLALSLYMIGKRRKRNKESEKAVGIGESRELKEATKTSIGSVPIFSYKSLQDATRNFHRHNILGDGGFATVYFGQLRSGRNVAVKKLYTDIINSKTNKTDKAFKQFFNEMKILSSLKHPRLIKLYGCSDPNDSQHPLLLVFEYAVNATLAYHLHGHQQSQEEDEEEEDEEEINEEQENVSCRFHRPPRCCLTWERRLRICVEVAEAVRFLHEQEPPIIHRDIKSTNVLLDEKWHVKLADFGLSKVTSAGASHVWTMPQGSPGYLDPDYQRCFHLTLKSDVYSLGVLFLEIISAQLPVDTTRSRGQVALADLGLSLIRNGRLHELVDPRVCPSPVSLASVAEVAFVCLSEHPEDRPSISLVHQRLLLILQQHITCQGVGGISPTSVVQHAWRSFPATPDNAL